MRCIFCKINSIDTISIEHVIPESLGNKEHVLPKGAVCDKCNNYFATKIEKELLENPLLEEAPEVSMESKEGANLFESCIIIAHLNMSILPINGFTIIISKVECLLGDINAKVKFSIHYLNILEFNGIKKESWVGEGLNQ